MRQFSKLFLLFAFLVLLTIPSVAGVRFGGIIIGAGYSHYFGPNCCYNSYYDSFDGPYYGAYYSSFHDPWYSPWYYRQPAATKGTLRLQKLDKTTEVYIDQAFAGVAGDLKTIYLDPGAYDLEVRPAGKTPVQKRVYVLSGKTLKLEF